MEKKKRSKSQVAQGIRAKGKDYERQVAKTIATWFCPNERGRIHRTPSSGAVYYPGDIVDDKHELPFVIECKKRQQLSFSGLLEKDSELWKFWKQCMDECDDPHFIPLLIFSQNYGSDYFMIPLGWFESLEEYCGVFSELHLKVQAYPNYVIVGKLKGFLEHFDSEMIKTIPELRSGK